ncbi:MAG: DNA replication/repair protein RecF [Firmicutes bacterium]|nr:DNA replication/repair protein RecF [Bacillota bacterium]MCL1953826.1 DNA replication/repair protein RecF [Bacillota bacterium]
MQIQSLQLKDFRNYSHADIEFDSGINLVLGENAQGKTSLLEAIYLCSVGKSARTSKEKELIKSGCDKALIQSWVKSNHLDKVSIAVDKVLKKTVSINSMPILRIGELMGVCSCVLFSPDEMNIIKDGPSERRRFMDIALSQMSKAYFYTLQGYNRILAQRNKLLKSGRVAENDLIVWDMQLVKEGCKIAKNRHGFLQRLENLAKARHAQLSDNKEDLVLSYDGYDASDLARLQSQFEKSLMNDRERDIKHGYTHSGVHKDDIAIAINNIDVRTYGSQGQQRTTVLSLKLAQIDLMQDMYGQKPILLLDDVLSELDHNRCKKLLEFCHGCQTIITATHIEKDLVDSMNKYSIFDVSSGKVARK